MAVVKKVKIKKTKEVVEELPVKLNWRVDPVFSIDGSSTHRTLDSAINEFTEDLNTSFSLSTQEYSEDIVPYFELEFTFERLPFCCGITEIGNLNISNSSTKNKRIFVNEIIQEFFDRLGKKLKGHTFIINTNGKDFCTDLELILSKCKDSWTMVKEFVNSNSKNTIKMWISNND